MAQPAHHQTSAIRWLHLSDLHLGCRGEEWWRQMEEELAPDIRAWAGTLGVPDLILITGDLTNRGAQEEFTRFDGFLERLLGWLREVDAAADPLILPVPGNHDLARPNERKLRNFRVLDDYLQGADNEDVRYLDEELWDERDTSLLDPLFGNYQAWFESSILPRLERACPTLHRSHFPGDYSVRLELPKRPALTLVGLNSAWLQYQGGDFERRLALPLRQFQAAVPTNHLPDGDLALLLMHHPPAWLDQSAQSVFREAIYPPGRFTLCLHGHMHRARSRSESLCAGQPHYYFQSPSLFGLEHYGTAKEERAIGYTWGQLAADATVRVWPLRRILRGDGSGAFVHDTDFPEDPEGVQIRPLKQDALPAVAPDLRDYLLDLHESCGHIDIRGIGSGAGKVREAVRHPIEELYTALRSRQDVRHEGTYRMDGSVRYDGTVNLAALLPRHPRLFIEGQPGSGKTTFLRLVASLLARDGAGVPTGEGRTWRSRYLGMDETNPPLPVFLRLSELALELDEDKRSSRDDRERLLDLLPVPAEHEPKAWRRHWRGLLERGKALLLLDGLDEVADEGLRQRVFAIFQDACRHWAKTPMVVTSRPVAGAGLRELGFHQAVIEPWGATEVGEFVGRWVAALYADTERPGNRGEDYRDRLLDAIVEQPAIRRLAANPVMLTCLCVVHWNEGELPEGRARVYRAVLRWLIAARNRRREQQGWGERFAWKAFARLALTMTADEKGKQAAYDLEAAARAVEPIVARDYPELSHPEDRRHRARDWLRFECLGSGVIEELSGSRIRFWHLTFQEYLAALQLAWYGDGEDPEADWWPQIQDRLEDSQWRETVELFPGCLLDAGGEGRVDRLLERVLSSRGDQPGLAEDARLAGIMGRLLQPLTAYQYKTPSEVEAVYRQVLDRAMAIFTREGAARVAVEDRIAAAEALGQGGDPRLRHDQWIEVPGLDGWRLGKYQVTVEEYRGFVEHGGYGDPRWWQAEGWTLREKEGWEALEDWDGQLRTPNRPVTGVSWWEAAAYCAWLGDQRGIELRLPQAEEWQRAATSPEGEYPWGAAEPDPERANYGQNVKAPTPVGVYPAGDGPFGHSDLAGNLWEWCEDEVSTPDGSPDEWKDDSWRHVRGGAWRLDPGYLRSAVRGRLPARYRYGFMGFRVAAAPAST